jgi:hypothetical protein
MIDQHADCLGGVETACDMILTDVAEMVAPSTTAESVVGMRQATLAQNWVSEETDDGEVE